MDKLYTKAILTGTKAKEDGKKVYTFQASTDATDRQDEVITADGWALANYQANPVILDSHDYRSIENIVGTGEVRQTGKGLEVDVAFNMSPRGRLAEQLVEEGSLRAVSVGFLSTEMQIDPNRKEPLKHTKKELLEISVVAVPANPEALRLRALQARAAIPPHTTPKAPEDMAWDGGEVMRMCEGASQLRKVCAWVNSDADPDLKGSYKLPHHMPDGEVVWRGVAAAMAALMGARGGVDIPEADRRGCYAHLSRHYDQFSKEPPEFKSLDELSAFGPEEVKGLFWEGELAEQPGQKAGRRISAKSRAAIQQAITILSDLLAEETAAADEEGKGEDGGGSKEIDLEEIDIDIIDVDLSALEALVRKDA